MKRNKPKFMIFKPAKSSMQSGLLNTKKWCLVTKDVENTFLSSKFCWTGSSNSHKKIPLFFDNKNSAIRFAEHNNYDYEIIEPKKRKVLKKSYASNFTRKD